MVIRVDTNNYKHLPELLLLSLFLSLSFIYDFQCPEHFAENGVRVNALCPWGVKTDMLMLGDNTLLPQKAQEMFDELKRLKWIT